MLDKYQGKKGRAALLNALRSQFLVDGNSDAANMLASATRVKDFLPGEVLFTERERGGDLLLLLKDKFLFARASEKLQILTPGCM